MSMRLSFEKYCSTVGLSTKSYYVGNSWAYNFPETSHAWDAWQAAYKMQQAEIVSLQATVDRLMLELQAQGLTPQSGFCPNEMSSMQLAEWAKNQKKAPEGLEDDLLYENL